MDPDDMKLMDCLQDAYLSLEDLTLSLDAREGGQSRALFEALNHCDVDAFLRRIASYYGEFLLEELSRTGGNAWTATEMHEGLLNACKKEEALAIQDLQANCAHVFPLTVEDHACTRNRCAKCGFIREDSDA